MPSPTWSTSSLQSSHETTLARTLWYRQVALDYRHDLPVLTVLVLLRKEANSPSLTGRYDRHMPDGRLTNRYDYHVVRLWREGVEGFLTGGVGLVPLAPLADITEDSLPSLVQHMAKRINGEPRSRAAKLWTATFLLMGLRYSDELTDSLLEGVQNMRGGSTPSLARGPPSSGPRRTCSWGCAIGRIDRFAPRRGSAARIERPTRGSCGMAGSPRPNGCCSQGEIRFGVPEARTRSAIEAIQDIERLERMSKRILDAEIHDWDGLLDEP